MSTVSSRIHPAFDPADFGGIEYVLKQAAEFESLAKLARGALRSLAAIEAAARGINGPATEAEGEGAAVSDPFPTIYDGSAAAELHAATRDVVSVRPSA